MFLLRLAVCPPSGSKLFSAGISLLNFSRILIFLKSRVGAVLFVGLQA